MYFLSILTKFTKIHRLQYFPRRRAIVIINSSNFFRINNKENDLGNLICNKITVDSHSKMKTSFRKVKSPPHIFL